MARRPSATLPEIPKTLQQVFDACGSAHVVIEKGDAGKAVEPDTNLVGQRLRIIRKSRGLSVRALSARSGLAINTLSMIEKGATSPSVSTLQVLAGVLAVPVAAFFEQEPPRSRVVYAPKGQRPAITVENTRLEHLGKDLAGSAVQPFFVVLEPGAGSGPSLIVHTGHEFVYCLLGEVTYTVEDQTYRLVAGDSIIFESPLPHSWSNTGDQPAHIILVLIPADLRDTPADRHFPLE